MPYEMTRDLERQIRAALHAVADAEIMCRQAEATGSDMRAEQAQCLYYRDRLQKILDTFTKRKVE